MSIGVDEGYGAAPRSARQRVALLGAAVLAIAVLTAGCQLRSSFQYVSHRAPDGVDAYFKVPVTVQVR